MSQSTLKVNELHEDADFDENSTETEIFDEKALVDDEPTESELADDELLAQGVTQRVLDATNRLFATANGRRRGLFCPACIARRRIFTSTYD